MMYARIIFAVFAILWVQSVCAGTDPIVVDRTEHPYVVGLRMNNGQNASGVVIAPHILLTVAHELFDVDGNKLSLAAIRVRNGSDRTYLPNVARIKIHARMETRLREGRRQKKIERDYAQLDVGNRAERHN